jgi:hypothetical protein
VHLRDIAVPDTSVARLALAVSARYASAALHAHSVRSYLWASAYASLTGIAFDDELLYVASVLHDLGLTEPFDSHGLPFEQAGGEVAWVFCAGAGWPEDRRQRVLDVVVAHMRPSGDPAQDPEGHLLEVGTSIDVGGAGLELIPVELQREVVEGWPRGALAAEFAACILQQAERKPTSRAAAAVAAGITGRLAVNPLEAMEPAAR